jgi:hypothetical protein
VPAGRNYAAGAPAPTRNIFCDPTADMCFNLTVSVKSFDVASAACAAMTGRLVTYTSAAKQLMVEQVGAWLPGQRCRSINEACMLCPRLIKQPRGLASKQSVAGANISQQIQH